jgi:acetolactate synthase-1/2/3 large subunit
LKIKLSDHVIALLQSLGVETVFCVSGGPIAHFMESVRVSGLECVHLYHEQSCAMAADAYARIKKKPAVVLVTNGPGASNTLTGVLAAYQDSIPMIIISGQVPRRQTIARSGKPLRQYGVQEAEIIGIVKSMTKYAVQVTDPSTIEMEVRKAYDLATSGRMGPVWLEIPLDVQAEKVENIQPAPAPQEQSDFAEKGMSLSTNFELVQEALTRSKRPLIVAGSGIHLSNGESVFLELVKKLDIPVVSTWSASDLFAHDDMLFVGNFGLLGTRAANLAIQNADLLLILGSRLSIPNIGYTTELFAPESKKIMVDIDSDEIEKVSLSIDIPVVADLKIFMTVLLKMREHGVGLDVAQWKKTLLTWKQRFNVFSEAHHRPVEKLNSYDFIEALSTKLKPKDVVVTDMGTSFTCTMQALRNTGSNRLLTSSALCPMGFGLPGAIGAYFADKSNRVFCIAGDGGFQMNLQELQAVVHYRIPVKIFILNSNGYLAISIMQDNLFEGRHFGSTPDSGVSAPEFDKIATAYGIPSFKISTLQALRDLVLDSFLNCNGPLLCEVEIPNNQLMIPRVQSTTDEDGKIVSGGIDKMFPYLNETQWSEIASDLRQE